MDEIKYYEQRKEEPPQEPTMSGKLDEIYGALKDIKKNQIRIPRKAKVGRNKQKKGYIGVLYIDENGNIRGEKEKIDGGTFREKKNIKYHATDTREILFWEGKYPIIIQPTWRKNPFNPRTLKTIVDKDGEIKEITNETYGQKYIMARMLADVIKIKAGGTMGLLWIVGIAVGGYVLYTLFTGGF